MAKASKEATAVAATEPEVKNELMTASDMGGLMEADSAPAPSARGDAGLGAEDIGVEDIILPRVGILQAMSPAVVEGRPGAKPGVWWMTPQNRPVSLEPEQFARFVPVKVFPSQRKWIDIKEGGGIECSAEGGQLIAREPNGLQAAKLIVDTNKSGNVTGVSWEGGSPTDDCRKCVYGPAAGACAAGKEPTGRGNPWLPKVVAQDGEQLKIPDEYRAPKCTSSIDTLALVAIPPFNGMPGSIEPAFISFSRTSQPAGKQLAGMVKLANTEPTWAKIYNLGAKKVTNDKGTFFVATVGQFGYSKPALMDQAKALFLAAKDTSFKPDMSEAAHEATTEPEVAVPKDDEAAPNDSF